MTPGQILQHRLDRLGWTQDETARFLGVSRFSINQLVRGRRGLTPEMAVRLERLPGQQRDTAEGWMRLWLAPQIAAARQKLLPKKKAER